MNIEEIIHDENFSIERKADYLLAHVSSGNDVSLELLKSLSQDDNEYMRNAVATSLGYLKSREVYNLLSKLLNDKESNVKDSAILSMGRNRDSRSLFCLVNLYKKASKNTKEKILISLSSLKDPRSYEFLEKIIKDNDDSFIQQLITVAISKINPKEIFSYTFHGNEDTLIKAKEKEGQIIVYNYNDIEKISQILEEDLKYSFLKPQTYIVDLKGNFVLGGYLNEHVFVAKGEDVVSAGEAGFRRINGKWVITYLNNRSNGYYPAASTFEIVKRSLEKTGIKFPNRGFTETFPKEGYFNEDFLSLQPFYQE